MTRRARFNWIDGTLVVLLLALAAVLGLPIYLGHLAMERTHRWLEASGTLIRYSTVSERRGWWSSELVADARLMNAPAQRWYLTIVHGPIYLGMLARERSPLVGAVLSMRRDTDPVPVMEIVSRYNGDWSLVVSNVTLEVNTPGDAGTPVALAAVRADVDFDARHTLLALRASVGRASSHSLELRDIAILGQYRLDPASAWPYGQSSIRIGRSLGRGRSVLIEGAELSLSNNRADDGLAFNLSARIEGVPYGDGQSSGVLTLDAGLRGVAANVLGQWLLGESPRPTTRQLFAGSELDVRNAELYSQRFAVLARGELDAQFGTAEEHRVVGWLDIAREAAEQLFLHQARTMLGRSELFGKLNEVDQAEQIALAETSAAKQLDVLTAQGYLRLSGGRYRSRFELIDGALTLNGKAVALP